MRCLLTILFLICAQYVYAQHKALHIGGCNFYVEQASNAQQKFEPEGKAECYATDSLNLYRMDNGNKKTLLLTHTLAFRDCDSNSECLELGNYVATDTTITFYSFWCKGGDQPVSPFGARKQVYWVDKKGKLKLIDSQLYIEACSLHWATHEGCEGVQFLLEKPKSKEDKAKFRSYVTNMEKQYNARFVFGKQSDSLLKETREVLKDEIYRNTHDWHTIESYQGFGIYK